MTDEYILKTSRGEKHGEYLCELTYNGKEVDFDLSYDLSKIKDELSLAHIRILVRLPQANNLESKISVEKLKRRKRQQE